MAQKDTTEDELPSVLLVDDEPELRKAMGLGLRARGYRVFEAGGAREALEFLARHPVQILITDYSMPGGDGFELLAGLSEMTDPPFAVMVSGHGGINVERAFDLGAEAVFSKPFSRESFHRMVQEFREASPDFCRRTLRTRADLPAQLRAEGQELRARVVNVGKRGLFVEHAGPPPAVGEKWHFVLDTGASLPIEGQAVVRWARGSKGEGDTLPPGFGLEFSSLEPRARKYLMHYVNFLRTNTFLPLPAEGEGS